MFPTGHPLQVQRVPECFTVVIPDPNTQTGEFPLSTFTHVDISSPLPHSELSFTKLDLLASRFKAWAAHLRGIIHTLVQDVLQPLIPRSQKNGRLRPILDLRHRSHMCRPFKRLTIKQILAHICPEDCFLSVDLKDAYFNNNIVPITGHS